MYCHCAQNGIGAPVSNGDCVQCGGAIMTDMPPSPGTTRYQAVFEDLETGDTRVMGRKREFAAMAAMDAYSAAELFADEYRPELVGFGFAPRTTRYIKIEVIQ